MNKPHDPNFILFDIKGVRYGMVCPDPNNPPFLPEGAKNAHLCVSPDRQYGYVQATQEEAREAFSQGFLEAGGDPAKLSSYFGLMRDQSQARLGLPPAEDEVPF